MAKEDIPLSQVVVFVAVLFTKLNTATKKLATCSMYIYHSIATINGLPFEY